MFRPIEKSLWLQKVCESNYRKLRHLIPDLTGLGSAASAHVPGKPPLFLRLLDRSPHTLTLELTHGFGKVLEPAVKIRVCLDAKTAEVLSDSSRPSVFEVLGGQKAFTHSVLDYKWTLNYFLMRWLDHCLSSQYRFPHEGEVPTAESHPRLRQAA